MYSDNQKEVFLKSSKKGYQFAAQNFQESLIEGFTANGVQLHVVSIPSLSTYPLGCSIPYVEDCDFCYRGNVLGRSFGYLNMPFFKKSNNVEIDDWVEKWYNTVSGEKYIVVYALLENQMSIAIRAKERHPDIKLCIVVLDLPRFMGCNKIYKMLGMQRKSINWIYNNIRYFDASVLLAEPMAKDLKIQNMPFVVIEGIYTYKQRKINKSKGDKRIILYTGALSARYGLKDLVDSFMTINNDRCRLYLCGSGDAVEYIKEQAKKDKRIVYLGMVSHDEVVNLQAEATLLVNPRHSGDEYTKYSFPSKTMEYLASGTPTLMSHLDCIPQEYDQHLYYFDDESTMGMARCMTEILKKTAVELSNKGQKAAEFIINNKTSEIQTKKIIQLLSSL